MAWIIVTHCIAKLNCRLQTICKFQVIHHAFLKCHEHNHWGPHIQRHRTQADYWILSFSLVPPSSITTSSGISPDWRGLAEQMGFPYEKILFFDSIPEPVKVGTRVWEKGLGLLERRGGASGNKRWGFWEEGVGLLWGVGLLVRRGGASGRKGRGFWEEGAGLLGGWGGASGR